MKPSREQILNCLKNYSEYEKAVEIAKKSLKKVHELYGENV